MMRRKLKILLIIVIVISIIPSYLIIINVITNVRIHYDIKYDVQLADAEQLIEQVETFDYLSHLKMHDCDGDVFNLTKFRYNYMDREYLSYLIDNVNAYFREVKIFPGYFYLTYFFNATEQTRIYLTYNNDTVFRAQFEGNEDNILLGKYPYSCYSGLYAGSWFINFSQVPYVLNESAVIPLNDIILVQITVEYDHLFGNVGGVFFTIKQTVILNTNRDIILIFIPHTPVMVA